MQIFFLHFYLSYYIIDLDAIHLLLLFYIDCYTNASNYIILITNHNYPLNDLVSFIKSITYYSI